VNPLDWDQSPERRALADVIADILNADAGKVLHGLCEAGVPWIGISEDAGGSGGDLGDAAIAARTLAAHHLQSPVAENSFVAGWILELVGIPVPRSLVTVAFESGPAVRVERTLDDWRLSGELHLVPFAAQSSAIAVLVDFDGLPGIALIATSDTHLDETCNLGGDARCTVTFHDVAPQGFGFLPAGMSIPDCRARLALLRCIQIAGALRSIRDMTVRYARERVQFGKPLSAIQSIAQSLARIAEQTLLIEAAVALALEEPSTWNCAIAKTTAGQGAKDATMLAHQVHGAMGISSEYPLGAMTTRIWSWLEEGGRSKDWAAYLGNRFLSQSSPTLWTTITH